MRTKLLIAAAGLVGLAAMPNAAQAQYWRGYGWYPHHRHYYPYWAPFYRPRVYYVPPPVVYAPPPPVYYAPPVYRPEPIYVAPHLIYRSHVAHRAVRRPVQRAASAAACTCTLPSGTQPAAVAPTLPALRPAPATPPNNLYPPERTQ